VLLAGVFTMHALTGNHDVAMAGHHVQATAVHVPEPVTAHLSTHDVDAAAPALTIEPGHGGHLHSMGDVCLAMLAALLLALIVALARRSHKAAYPVQLTGTDAIVSADVPSPPWRRPSLSKLCVLRT
jgi:hypothetical protein